jgi:hypothetical protein
MKSKNLNISRVNNNATANTRLAVAQRRAENLAALGVGKAIELCVGPSLRRLEVSYKAFGISLAGNDVEARWRDFYPEGDWYIGDALATPLGAFDAAVFAPPLSLGCTGRRIDALMIEEVTPSYYEFLSKKDLPGVVVLVLPGRTMSTRRDRTQLYRLLNFIGSNAEAIEMKDERNRTTKYVDVYIGA